MFISVSSGAYNGHSLRVAFEEVARIGATHLELIFIHGFSDPFEESFFSSANAAELRALYSHHGLEPGAFAAHLDLSKEDAVGQFLARMDFAKALGSQIVITYAAPLDRERDFYVNMEKFARHAADIDITIALENPGDGRRNVVDSGRSGAEALRRIGSPWVKFNYDFGNLMSHFGEDLRPEDDIWQVAPETAHLHVKDSRRVEDGWVFPEVGTGDIDFGRVFRELDSRGLRPPLCLEVPVGMRRDVFGRPSQVEPALSAEETSRVLKGSLEYARRLTTGWGL